MYALDTNTVIYFFKNQGQVAPNLLAKAPSEIAIPAIVLFELETGIAKSRDPKKRQQQLAHLLQFTRILPFNAQVAKTTANLRARLETTGQPIGPMDTLIAGTALHHQATLVTHNTNEFSRIPNLELEDWY